MSGGIAVSAIGMTTSLGLDAPQSCAAARAGLAGLSALEGVQVLDEESGEMLPVLGHLAAGGILADYQGSGRLIELTRLALADLSRSIDPVRSGRLPLYLCVGGDYYVRQYFANELAAVGEQLPSPIGEIVELESARFRDSVRSGFFDRLAEQFDSVDADRSRLIFGEQASVATLLKSAIEALDRDEIPGVIIGGVDTLVDEVRIGQLASLRLIKTPVLDSGFFPGEAAALFCLCRADRAETALAILGETHTSSDDCHRLSGQLPLGEVFAEVLRPVLSNGGQPPERIIDNLNGDHWQSWDWGHAVTRIGSAPANIPQWHPAEAFGEIGAATIPSMVCVAARAFARRYAAADRILACVSANDGVKASLTLARAS